MYSLRIPKIFALLYLLIIITTFAQDSTADNTVQEIQKPINQQWYQKVEKLNFVDSSLRDILQAVAIQNGLNIIIDRSVDETITLHLNNIRLWDLIVYLAEEYDLSLAWKGSILLMKKEIGIVEETIKPETGTLDIIFQDSLLSIIANDYSLKKCMEELSGKLDVNILVDQKIDQTVTGSLSSLSPDICLKTFLQYNGLSVRKQDGIYHVYEAASLTDKSGISRYKQWITTDENGNVSLDITDCPIDYAIQEITNQAYVPIINYSEIKGRMTAKAKDIPVEKALDILLKNTQLTYRYNNGVYFIGDRNIKGMASRELIKLNHIKSDGVVELLPKSITSNAEIKEVKELNSIMIIATKDIVEEAKNFISEIDQTVPQIMIEAIVIDYTVNDIDEFQLKFGLDETQSSTAPIQLYPFLEGTVTQQNIANRVTEGSSGFISRNIGKLPVDFYAQIKAMEQEGYAKVQSKPHIATLNGHTASISVSTTQYYIFDSKVIIPTSSTTTTQTTQRFEKISAEVKLEITPWISADGEVTVEIHPEFSTPVGSFDPNVPPTINSRILNSTVRLRDGETIVLGGLIQSSENNSHSKFPLLGNIPLIGALFKDHYVSDGSSELVIYLTPHLNMEPVDLNKVTEPIKKISSQE